MLPNGQLFLVPELLLSVSFWVTHTLIEKPMVNSFRNYRVTGSRLFKGPIYTVYLESRSRQSSRSIPGPSVACQRSPTFSSRFGMVLIVNLAGSRPFFTSDHFNGVETVAPGQGRTP